MRFKALIMDETAFGRAVTRISHEILEKNRDAQDVVLLGIRRRGMPIAQMIQQNIYRIENVMIPCGELDIRLYRDDLVREHEEPQVRHTQSDFEIKDKIVILVDDVLYTGRTARAAIEATFALGRPRCIQIAVLIDRGHRELPVRADYVGKTSPRLGRS